MTVSWEDYTRVFKQYREKFGQYFPTQEYRGSNDDIYRLMVEAIEKGEPVRLNYKPGVTY